MLKPWTSKLRDWQTRAVEAACIRSGQDFLAMATPAAGKTTFALRVAHQYLSDGAAVRVVVVCPTTHLRTQWAQAGGSVGLQLDPNLTNEHPWEARDYHGSIVTYQQVCLAPELFARACQLRPTLVILETMMTATRGTRSKHRFMNRRRICANVIGRSWARWRERRAPIIGPSIANCASGPEDPLTERR
jgi:hypothetical protein